MSPDGPRHPPRTAPVAGNRPRADDRPRGGPVVPNPYARREHDPHDDVSAARANVRHAGVSYGPRVSRRAPRDLASDWLRSFVLRYGWRAYAVPVLAILTVAALMTTAGGSKPKPAAAAVPGGKATTTPPPVAGGHIALKDDPTGNNIDGTVLKAAALPPGAAYTQKGTGTFRILRGTSPKVGTGQLFRYSIDVENGVAGVDLAQFQQLVVSTLADPRSWSGHGVALERVDSGHIDFHVSLTSSLTVRDWCGYSIQVETSCYQPATYANGHDVNRVVFNVSRWVRGSTAYVGDLPTYRLYMINHEDGHALGHQHAHQCLPDGLAPAMMQQTFGLRSAATGKLCGANPWPYPVGVPGAPGAEQADTAANNEYGKGD